MQHYQMSGSGLCMPQSGGLSAISNTKYPRVTYLPSTNNSPEATTSQSSIPTPFALKSFATAPEDSDYSNPSNRRQFWSEKPRNPKTQDILPHLSSRPLERGNGDCTTPALRQAACASYYKARRSTRTPNVAPVGADLALSCRAKRCESRIPRLGRRDTILCHVKRPE